MPQNTTTNATGHFSCPKCGYAPMIPMKKGNGWRCGCPGNYWQNNRWTKCDGVRWQQQTGRTFKREIIERPLDFPVISKPTDDQKFYLTIQATAPHARPVRSRLTISNSGPGCAKSTTGAAGCANIYRRVGPNDILGWHFNAFNVNARISIEKKMPTLWSNVSTINGFGGRIQNYNFRNYKTAKLRNMFREWTAPLPEEKRPNAGPLFQIVERARDLLLYSANEGDSAWWETVLETVMDRFPGIAKRVTENNIATIRQYLPMLMVRGHAARGTIDLTEQYTRPATEAIHRTGWKMRPECCKRDHEWTDNDISHFCNLVKAIDVPQQKGCIVDEAQDLSLSQIALFLASTWKSGELTLVGDDKQEEPYRAGQAIFGWRGAFAGSLAFIERCWFALTGERANHCPLNVTFRLPPEIVDAVRPLNSTLVSAKPRGTGEVWQVSESQAFQRWLAIDDETETALWITRRNAPLAPVFIDTIRERKKCCLRGGGEMQSQVDSVLYTAAGWYNDDGEFRTSLTSCIAKLSELVAQNEEGTASADADSMESFLLEIAQEIEKNPDILREAELDGRPTVGNLRRFVLYFADKDAPRVLSTVYRSKGDEADLVIVSDCDAFNQPWNGDSDEAAACRHVAATRAKRTLLVCGALSGVIAPPAPDGEMPEVEISEIQTPEVSEDDWDTPAPAPVPQPESKPAPVAKKRGRPAGSKDKAPRKRKGK